MLSNLSTLVYSMSNRSAYVLTGRPGHEVDYQKSSHELVVSEHYAFLVPSHADGKWRDTGWKVYSGGMLASVDDECWGFDDRLSLEKRAIIDAALPLLGHLLRAPFYPLEDFSVNMLMRHILSWLADGGRGRGVVRWCTELHEVGVGGTVYNLTVSCLTADGERATWEWQGQLRGGSRKGRGRPPFVRLQCEPCVYPAE